MALYRDDHTLTIGRHGLEKRLRTGFHVPMQQDLAVLVEDTDIHGAGMQIDAAVKLVLFGVESPEVSSSLASGDLPVPAYHGGRLRRGPQ
jgi:hypothetical protein